MNLTDSITFISYRAGTDSKVLARDFLSLAAAFSYLVIRDSWSLKQSNGNFKINYCHHEWLDFIPIKAAQCFLDCLPQVADSREGLILHRYPLDRITAYVDYDAKVLHHHHHHSTAL